MAKKTRKVLKQQSYQRAIRQSVANVSTTVAVDTPAAANVPAAEPVTGAQSVAPRPSVSGLGISALEEFGFVRSDVRKSMTLAAVFIAVLVALSFVIK